MTVIATKRSATDNDNFHTASWSERPVHVLLRQPHNHLRGKYLRNRRTRVMPTPAETMKKSVNVSEFQVMQVSLFLEYYELACPYGLDKDWDIDVALLIETHGAEGAGEVLDFV